jgi:ABC-type transporter Mla subunit MlaD
MRRLFYLALVVAILPWIVIGIVREANDDDTNDAYYVRAIFDNASTLVTGEDVKVAGAKVGVISDMDVTDERRAAVTLRIDDADFQPFKEDASCIIRLQGLIGERFVECEPGSAQAEALTRIEDGDGQGERLLPVERNSSPVDLDLLNNVMRLPYRQRFAILLNELGTGLAGRGEELGEVIHRANPALRETEALIKTLARQNRSLVRLAEDADRALAPLARERRRVSSWIVQANTTGEASAERRDDIRRGFRLLPDFLRELRPLMADLEGFADQGTPLLADLRAAAPDLGRLIEGQGALSRAARESFPSLGDALERGRPALIRALPLFRNLGRFAEDARPLSEDLDELTASLEKTGGTERLMDLALYLGLSTNGFDAIGHYLRAGLITNTCSNYTLVASPGCTSTFYDPSEEASASLAANNAAEPKLRKEGSVPSTGYVLGGLLGAGETAQQRRERERNLERLRDQASRPSPGLGPVEPALDYLLGAEQ